MNNVVGRVPSNKGGRDGAESKGSCGSSEKKSCTCGKFH